MSVYTPKMLAERWQCSAQTIYNMVERGDLAAFTVGGKLLRIRGDVVEAFEQQGGAVEGAPEGSLPHGASEAVRDAQSNTPVASEQARPKTAPLKPLLSVQERRALLAGR